MTDAPAGAKPAERQRRAAFPLPPGELAPPSDRRRSLLSCVLLGVRQDASGARAAQARALGEGRASVSPRFADQLRLVINRRGSAIRQRPLCALLAAAGATSLGRPLALPDLQLLRPGRARPGQQPGPAARDGLQQ